MRSLRIMHSIVRVLLLLSVLGFGTMVYLVDTVPGFGYLYELPNYLLLMIAVFGIIEVRLPAVETHARERERPRIWPYVFFGITVLAGVLYWVTTPWSMLWRVGLGVYGAVVLATLLLIVLEE